MKKILSKFDIFWVIVRQHQLWVQQPVTLIFHCRGILSIQIHEVGEFDCDLTRFYHVTIEEELRDWESALSLNSLRTLTWQILQECGVGEDEDEVESDGSARSASGVCLPVFQVWLKSLAPIFFRLLHTWFSFMYYSAIYCGKVRDAQV